MQSWGRVSTYGAGVLQRVPKRYNRRLQEIDFEIPDSWTERWRKQVVAFINRTVVGVILDVLNTLLSLMACVLYVLDTYPSFQENERLFNHLEYAMVSFFSFDYVLRFFIAEHRLLYIISPLALVDLVTIVPVVAQWGGGGDIFGRESNVVQILRLLRVARVLRVQRMFWYMGSAVNRQVFVMVLAICSIGFVWAGAIHFIENETRAEHDQLMLHDVFYFIAATISTTGYGDVVPKSVVGKLVTTLLLIVVLVLIPKQAERLLALLSSRSVFVRQSYRPSRTKSHVVVAGDLSPSSLDEVFREVFHADHGVEEQDLQAVILSPYPPSAFVLRLLNESELSSRITYIQGSPFKHRDLERAGMHHAAACFLLTNKFAPEPEEADAQIVLMAMAVKRFVANRAGRRLRVLIQIIRPENANYFLYTTQSTSTDLLSRDQVVCVERLKMKLLAKSCEVPGVIAFIANLITPMSSTAGLDATWMDAYADGTAFELYSTPLARDFEGVRFSDAVSVVFQETGSTLFALEVTVEGQHPRVLLNPGHFVIPPLLQNCVLAFVIAPTKLAADLTFDCISQAALKRHGCSCGRHRGVDTTPALQQAALRMRNRLRIMRQRLRPTPPPHSTPPLAFVTPKRPGRSAPAALSGPPSHKSSEDTHARTAPEDHTQADTVSALVDIAESKVATERPKHSPPTVENPALENAELPTLGVPSVSKKDSVPPPHRSHTHTLRTRAVLMGRSSASQSKHVVQPKPPKPTKALSFRSWIMGSQGTKRDIGALYKRGYASAPSAGAEQGGASRLWFNRQESAAKIISIEDEGEYVRDPDHFSRLFYVLKHPACLKNVTIRSSLQRDFPNVKNHVLVCGNVRSLYHFILTLRTRFGSVVRPIVLLAPTLAPHLWSKIAFFPEVYYVQGSALEVVSLRRAGIATAEKAVLLAKPHKPGGQQNKGSLEALVDSGTIFAHRAIARENPDVEILTELLLQENIPFVSPVEHKFALNTKRIPHHLYPHFAAGRVFSSSLIDAIVCQAFYNPVVTSAIERLVSAGDGTETVEVAADEGKAQPDNAAGSMNLDSVQRCALQQIDMPKAFEGRTYGELFHDFMIHHAVLVVGLYRGVWTHLGHGPLGNHMPFVQTCPAASTKLFNVDKVFVLQTMKSAKRKIVDLAQHSKFFAGSDNSVEDHPTGSSSMDAKEERGGSTTRLLDAIERLSVRLERLEARNPA